uniref:epidermal growth factor receptor substrate 15-like 1 isoform X2 n=1 Tax=Myxine glutinosa TaxID=7769 RepID=UPI00358E2173
MAGTLALTELSSGNPLYEKYYRQVDPNNSGVIGAADAALFLKRSNLSDVVLGKIWDVADSEHKGWLDKQGEGGSPRAGEVEWAVKPDEKRKFDEIFNSLGPLSGLLTGEQVRPVLLNSNLPLDLLGRVWDLSDIDRDGHLDKDEFAVAMHLVYRLLEKEPLPTSLPHRFVPPSKRAKTPGLAGAVSVLPSSPPAHRSSLRSTPSHGSLTSIGSGSSLSPKGAPRPPNAVAAPWVVPATEKAAYDEIFAKADTDHDGLVSGMESRNIFLLSGLPQQILAHVWSLADTRQQGMLNSEQFALAMYLIQQKVTLGIDPPVSLTQEMIPPSERTQEAAIPSASTDTATNKELELLAAEISELSREKSILEQEIREREAAVRSQSHEVQELQLAVDRAGAGLQDVSSQQQQWRQRLADLEQQRAKLHAMLTHAHSQAREEQAAISSLQLQIATQESALRGQEEELVQEKTELVHLSKEEADLEQRLEAGRRELAALAGTLQKTQGDIHQVRACLAQQSGSEPLDKDSQLDGSVSKLDTSTECTVLHPPSAPPPRPDPFPSDESFHLDDPFRGSDPFQGDPFSGQDATGFTKDPFGEDPFKAADPFPKPSTNSFGKSGEDFFAKSGTDSFSSSGSEAFAKKDPFSKSGSDPFGKAGADPFGNSGVDLFPSSGSDPFNSTGNKSDLPFADPFAPGGVKPKAGKSMLSLDPFSSFTETQRPSSAEPRVGGSSGTFSDDPFVPKGPMLPPKRSAPPRPRPPVSTGHSPPIRRPASTDPFSSEPFAPQPNAPDLGLLGNEAAQIAWARRESTRAETERRARLRQQEHADLALAIALSKADMGSS